MLFSVLWMLINPLVVISHHSHTVEDQNIQLPVHEGFPTPPQHDKLMFYLQRDPNANTICYELNIDGEGKLKTGDPINASWIRYTEGGIKKDLNYIQRTFAFGIKARQKGNGVYDLKSVAYGKLPMTLQKGNDKEYHVFTNINDRKSILKRIFVRIEGGSFWSPNVLYIEVAGVDLASGKEIYQRFKP